MPELTFDAGDKATREVLTTFRRHQNTFIDNVHQGSPFLSAARRKGVIRAKPIGGSSIIRKSRIAEGGNFTDFDGLDTIEHAGEDVHDAAEYFWRFTSLKIAVAMTDLLKNRGTEKAIDLWGEEVERGKLDFTERHDKQLSKTNAQFASDDNTSSSKTILGLPDIVFVQNGGTTIGQNTLGGQDRSVTATAWFRNQGKRMGSDHAKDLTNLWVACNRAGIAPDMLFCGLRAWEFMGTRLFNIQANQNLPTSGRPTKFQAGFTGVLFHNMEAIFCRNIVEDNTIGNSASAGVAYMVSSRNWHII